jgi:hypothetical protein
MVEPHHQHAPRRKPRSVRAAPGRPAGRSLPGCFAANRRAVVLVAYTDNQNCGVDKPVHDVVRKSDLVVPQGRLAPAALRERRRLARRERGRRLDDVDMLPAVKGAHRRHLNRRPGPELATGRRSGSRRAAFKPVPGRPRALARSLSSAAARRSWVRLIVVIGRSRCIMQHPSGETPRRTAYDGSSAESRVMSRQQVLSRGRVVTVRPTSSIPRPIYGNTLACMSCSADRDARRPERCRARRGRGPSGNK